MTRVLITDGHLRSVLAACRSLRRAGYSVAAAASEHPAATHWSRFCGKRLSITDPKGDPASFVEQLRAVVSGDEYEVLIPGTDASLLAISRHRERLQPLVRLGLPSPEVVERSLSRIALLDAAEKAELPAPETAVCTHEEAALAAARRFGYPVILKPSRTIFEQDGRWIQRGSAVVEHEDTLVRLLAELESPWLVQRREPGTLISFGGVMAEDRLLACAVSRYSRTWPPDAGNVGFSETIPADPELRHRVRDLVASLGWQGVFELELVEPRDGTALAIDFNPRVYGSLALADRAGAPLPAIWCEWLQGRESEVVAARPGYRYRWEDAELRHLWWLLRRGRIRAAISLIRPRRRTVRAHLWLSDPLPLVARGIALSRRRAGLDAPRP